MARKYCRKVPSKCPPSSKLKLPEKVRGALSQNGTKIQDGSDKIFPPEKKKHSGNGIKVLFNMNFIKAKVC